MRWDQQKLDDDGAALLPLKGMIRTVTTPEFDGVSFHEIACRTALNQVPPQSSMPFRWTINTTRGCLHQCVYCLAADTLILMADGRQKPIADLRVGDRVIGTQLDGDRRRLVETEVHAHWQTVKPAWQITVAQGTEIVASGDHRFLTEHGWTYVARAPGSEAQGPALAPGHRMMGWGLGDLSCGEGPYAGAPDEPAASWRRELVGEEVTTSADLRVMSVRDLGVRQAMFDITTGTGDFVANGVVSHNCFARKTHEYLDLDSGRDFDTQIIVKTNVAEVLRAELAKPSWRREHVALGTNSDPYMRAEGRYRLMPGIITALADSGTPFSILTKGPLLRRDLPLLKEAVQRVPVSVAVSLAMVDTQLQQTVEPGTPDPRARLGLIRAIADAGLDCQVLAMPILPWLTDSEEHLDALHSALAEAGARDVTTGALHLRPGAREWFLRWLADQHPHLVGRYRRLYRGGSYADRNYRRWLGERAAAARRRHGFGDGTDPMWRGGSTPEAVPADVGPQPALF